MAKKRLVFMNGGKHFWNREKEIVVELSKHFEILLVINHTNNINYSIDDIIKYCAKNKILLKIIDFSKRRASDPKKFFLDYKNVLAIRKFKPDLIYIESFGSPYFALFAGLLFNSKKTIFAILDYKLHPYGENSYKFSEKFYQFIYLKFFKNYHLFSSEQIKMMKEDHPKKNIFHIKLFLIKNDFPALKHSAKRNSDTINFLFFGKIHYYKGVDILIKAGNILSKYKNNFKITIAGNCSDFSQYENLIKYKKHFDLKIRFLSKEEIPELFKEADYIILPYREVTQSGPLMIAYNFGIVPIVSDLGGFKELVTDDQNGFIFQTGSSEDLAKKMKYIIDLDPNQKKIILNNLKNYITAEYNVNKFSQKYIEMFENITNT